MSSSPRRPPPTTQAGWQQQPVQPQQQQGYPQQGGWGPPSGPPQNAYGNPDPYGSPNANANAAPYGSPNAMNQQAGWGNQQQQQQQAGGWGQPVPGVPVAPIQQQQGWGVAPQEGGAWQPPQQQGVGMWPAPSAMPERQDSWGMAPHEAQWVQMETPGVFQQAEPVSTVDANTKSEDKWTGGEQCNIVFCWIFTLPVWFLLLVVLPMCEIQKSPSGPLCGFYWDKWDTDAQGRPGRNAIFFVVLGILYVLYLCGCLACPIRGYLNNILPSGVEPYLASLRTATPVIKWYIRCYHSESRGSGKNRRTVTVTTHTAEYDYPYDSWWDVSAPMANTGSAIATRVRLQREWKASDPHTQSVHDKLHAVWVMANDRDRQKSVTITVHVEGWKDSLLSFRDAEDPPCGLSGGWYLMFSFLTLGVLYQHYFYVRTTATDFLLTKLIRRIPRPDDPQ